MTTAEQIAASLNSTAGQLEDAALAANLMVQRLRAAHSAACVDKPTTAEKIAAAHLLELIGDAAKLADRIKAIT